MKYMLGGFGSSEVLGYVLRPMVSIVSRNFLKTLWSSSPLKIKAILFFESPEKPNPRTELHFSENLNLQL
jgi:hypothetical protein